MQTAIIITIGVLAVLSMGIGIASDYSHAKTKGGKSKTRRKKH
jgi:hypothetical protein